MNALAALLASLLALTSAASVGGTRVAPQQGTAVAQSACQAFTSQQMVEMDSKLVTLRAAIDLLLDYKKGSATADTSSSADMQKIYCMLRPVIAAADGVKPSDAAASALASASPSSLASMASKRIASATDAAAAATASIASIAATAMPSSLPSGMPSSMPSVLPTAMPSIKPSAFA